MRVSAAHGERDAGRWRSCARPGWRRRARRRPLAAGGAGADRRRRPDRRRRSRRWSRRAADPAEPRLGRRGRGLDPREGEHLLDLCAGPGIKTGQIAARMEDRGEVISVELDPGRAAEVAAQALPPRPAQRHRVRGRRYELGWRPASTGSCSTRPARTSAPSPRAPTRAGANRRRRSSAWSRSRSGRCAAPRELLRPGGTLVYATCTISRRENEDRVAALLPRRGRARSRRSTRGSRRPRPGPRLAARAALPAAAPRPRRTTGFFIARLKRDD